MGHLSRPGEKITYDDQGRCKSETLNRPGKQGFERVAYWQPIRTHDIGIDEKGRVHDRISIWRQK